jgi:hypothetical protein
MGRKIIILSVKIKKGDRFAAAKASPFLSALIFLLSANRPSYTYGNKFRFFCCLPTVRHIHTAVISDFCRVSSR